MFFLKKILPQHFRRFLKHASRSYKDLLSGDRKKFASSQTGNFLTSFIFIEQEIRTTETSLNKVHNIGIAINKLDGLIIQPGELFSFWHLIKNPLERTGYKKSRSIVKGKLEAETGGGLCQLSGLIYFLALRAGLTIVERHAHSIDIYTEEERFTPLGSDATVAYGYKDLRIKNELGHPVQLRLSITDEKLTGMLCCEEKLPVIPVEFLYQYHDGFTEVTTLNGQQILSCDTYLKNKVRG